MKHYTPLTQEQRYQIYTLMKAGLNQTEIANIVGVHKSTISHELRHNQGRRGYRAQQAYRFCLERRCHKVCPRITTRDWRLIERLLRQQWSPEKISTWLHKKTNISISMVRIRVAAVFQAKFRSNNELPLSIPVAASATGNSIPSLANTINKLW